MTRRPLSLSSITRPSTLAIALFSVCLVGGGLAVAQTKQLKSSATPSTPSPSETASLGTASAPQNFSRSYSVVVETQRGEDGKTVQKKKVWQDGQLVESEEKTLDASDDADATIDLPNGRIVQGQIAPGLPNAIDPSTIFGDRNESPFETMRRMEAQWREQQERLDAQMRAQFENLRRQFAGDANAPFGLSTAAPSKYWIGANVETTPEMVAAQLPLEGSDSKEPEGKDADDAEIGAANVGILIQAIVPESPAANAGLRRYDVVVRIDGKTVANAEDVGKLVDEIGAKTVKVEYFRQGKLVEADLTIAERPQAPAVFSDQIAPASKQFRIVRPGLIVPTPEAEAAKVEGEKSAESAESAPNAEGEATPEK